MTKPQRPQEELLKLDTRNDVEKKLAKLVDRRTNSCPFEDYNYEPWEDCDAMCRELPRNGAWLCWLKYAIDLVEKGASDEQDT